MIIKIKDLPKIRHRYIHKKIVFAGGIFDLFHVGHLRYLQRSKKLGDILVVNIVNDKRTKLIKGRNRPIINQNQRAEIIDALKIVDYVIINPLIKTGVSIDTIAKLQPDVFMYNKKEGLKKIIAVCPHIKLIKNDRFKKNSTTKIINKIK
jgi:rfaE bifunctional protein nucleotidyltransferase chain/domain